LGSNLTGAGVQTPPASGLGLADAPVEVAADGAVAAGRVVIDETLPQPTRPTRHTQTSPTDRR
jgi:hypothetical protein